MWISLCLCILILGQDNKKSEEWLKESGAFKLWGEEALPITSLSSSTNTSGYIYLLDTVNLPFVVDFSKDRIKKFDSNPDPSNIIKYVWYKFSVNGQFPKYFPYKKDTTYIYEFNGSGYNKYTQSPYEIKIYEEKVYPLQTKIQYNVWLPYDVYIIGGDTLWEALLPDTTLYNSIDTLYLIKDDSISLIISEGAHMHFNAFGDIPTMGIAIFNGLNKKGEPYSYIPGSWGVGDMILSKPINLKYQISDSLYFSFYWGRCGYGEMPEIEDSLILEFYSPTSKQWYKVWTLQGGTCDQTMYQTLIPIKDTLFLQKGFRFRFYSYASLYGPFDYWFIDYIKIDTLRSYNNYYHNDIGFAGNIASALGDYFSVPFTHYTSSPSNFITPTTSLYVRNLWYVDKFMTANFTVYDVDNSSEVYTGTMTVHPNVPPLSLYKVDFANNFTFPTSGAPPRNFSIRYFINSTPDVLQDNDTLIINYTLDTYYAYDDGTPEKAYTIYGTNGKVALEYNILINDAIKGVLIYFPPGMNTSNMRFKVKVWDASFNEIASSDVFLVNNGWVRIPLAYQPTVSGKIYVGYEQLDVGPMYVGLDMNNDKKSKTFYNIGQGWQNTSYSGVLMIRPDFGNATLSAYENNKNLKGIMISSLPNKKLCIDWSMTGNEIYTINIYDITGNEVKKINARDLIQKRIEVELSVGLYIISFPELGITKKAIVIP